MKRSRILHKLVSNRNVKMTTNPPHQLPPSGLPKLPESLSDRFVLSDQRNHHFVMFNDLIRVQGNGSYSVFFLSNSERITTSRRLNVYWESLENQGFLRTHQSHLVNIQHISKLQRMAGATLVMSNGDLVPVSQGFHKLVLVALGL